MIQFIVNFQVGPGNITNYRKVAGKGGWIGITQMYNWNSIESNNPGVYNWTNLDNDLALAKSVGLKYYPFIRLTTFIGTSPAVPNYMWADASYGGESTYYGSFPRTGGGRYPAWWNANVRTRMNNFYAAMAARYSGDSMFFGTRSVESTAETGAAWGGSVAALRACYEGYCLAYMGAKLGGVFNATINYCAWGITTCGAWAVANGMGLACPDTNFSEPDGDLMTVTFPMFLGYKGTAIRVPECQAGNYTRTDYATGVQTTVGAILQHTIDLIDPEYMSWTYSSTYFDGAGGPDGNNVLEIVQSHVDGNLVAQSLPLVETF